MPRLESDDTTPFNLSNPRAGHIKLMELMMKLNYTPSDVGACQGFSHVGLQAFLTGHMETFNQRLSYLMTVDAEQLSSKVQSAKKRRIALVNSSDVKNTTKNMTREQERDFIDSYLTEEEKQLLSIEPFFESIVIYSRPELYPHLFEQKTIQQHYSALASTRVMSEALEDATGLFVAGGFSGVYNQNELVNYFECLKSTANDAAPFPVSFELHDIHHSISIGFDGKTWSFIDINYMPVQLFTSAEDLSAKICSTFKRKGDEKVCFATKVCATGAQKKEANALLYHWRRNPKFKSMHQITNKGYTLSDNDMALWFESAAHAGYIDDIRELLKHTSASHPINAMAPNPILNSILYDNINVLKLLLAERSVDPNYNTNVVPTPLMFAIQIDNADAVLAIVENPRVDINLFSGGMSPLTEAIEYKKPELIEILLNHRADPNMPDLHGQTPLGFAIEENFKPAVISLLKHPKTDVNQFSGNGTPLLYAINAHAFDIAELLLEHGADPNLGTTQNLPALFFAIKRNNEPAVEFLLKNEKTDINCLSNGFTPLAHLLENRGSYLLIEMLLQHGADPNIPTPKGKSPLNLALIKNDHHSIKLLIQKGAKFNPLETVDRKLISEINDQEIKDLLNNTLDASNEKRPPSIDNSYKTKIHHKPSKVKSLIDEFQNSSQTKESSSHKPPRRP